MKIMTLKFFRSIATVTMTCVMILLLSSCSKEDGETGFYDIAGRWVREYAVNSRETAIEEYDFWQNGEGDYENSNGVMGTFTYNISSPSTVNIKIKYWNVYRTWYEDYTWTYFLDGDNLTLNGKMYKRYH